MKFTFDTFNPRNAVKLFITCFIFLALWHLQGFDSRESQQFYFSCGIMAIMAFYMRNIWITGFILWTLFIFVESKFTLGQIYISNIFLGSLLYFLTKVSFKREDIDKYLRVFCYFIALNCLFMIFQTLNFDFTAMGVYDTKDYGFVKLFRSSDPVGFMMFKGAMGMVMALAIPILMTREYKLSFLMAVGMFVPLYLSESSIAILAGVTGFLISLYYTHRHWGKFYRFRRMVIVALSILLFLGAVTYLYKKDNADSSLRARTEVWYLALQDTMVHPIRGWGLDSFRSFTKDKNHIYAINRGANKLGGITANNWDNPHNILVSLPFEWGYPVFVFFIGYIAFLFNRFMRSERLPNTVALFSVIIVTLVLSMAQFPLFLARTMAFIIPLAALYEVETDIYGRNQA